MRKKHTENFYIKGSILYLDLSIGTSSITRSLVPSFALSFYIYVYGYLSKLIVLYN